jgi:hypothetical protein
MRDIRKALQVLFPFAPGPSIHDAQLWGVWNRRRSERWAERTLYDEEWAERIATALNEAYAAGLTDAMIGKVRSRRRRSR